MRTGRNAIGTSPRGGTANHCEGTGAMRYPCLRSAVARSASRTGCRNMMKACCAELVAQVAPLGEAGGGGPGGERTLTWLWTTDVGGSCVQARSFQSRY